MPANRSTILGCLRLGVCALALCAAGVARGEADAAPTIAEKAETPEIERTPLGTPGDGAAAQRAESSDEPRQSAASRHEPGSWMWRTLGALAVVMALLLLLKQGVGAWARRGGGLAGQLGAGGRAPSGVLFILGRFPAARGQTLVLMKMGPRVLLLSQSTQGFRPLAEVTDPDEVAQLVAMCERSTGDSPASRFGALLRGMERDPDLIREHLPDEVPLIEPETVPDDADDQPSRFASIRRLRGIVA